jgi:DNA-binding LytR/AlgR family response regulator
MEIKVLIIEDNPLTSLDLKEIIQSQGMIVTKIAKNNSEALEAIQTTQPDILLVDINLHGGDDGVELVEMLSQKQKWPVVYLTANSDRETLNRALKTNPASFLTKPYDDKDVVIALELAFNNYVNKAIEGKSNVTYDFIFLKSGTRFEKVKLADINFLQAEGSYTRFITPNKEYTLSGNLNNISNKIGNSLFLRIHRSYVVNIDSITGLDNDNVFIGDQNLPISRSYREDVNKALRRIS